MLKADLHLHTREGEAFITYGARELIARAAERGFDVLSLTNHDTLTFDPALADYAGERGILLIPGVEATVEGKHVLLYNPPLPPDRLRTFADLRRHARADSLIVAAHPFYPRAFCLQKRLRVEIDVFDAVEFSHFYTRWIDFNRPAVELARETGLPLLGTSDSHLPRQLGTTYSIIDADRTVESVLGAIRAGRVRLVTRPLTFTQLVTIAAEMTLRSRRGPRSRAVRWPEWVSASACHPGVVAGQLPRHRLGTSVQASGREHTPEPFDAR